MIIVNHNWHSISRFQSSVVETDVETLLIGGGRRNRRLLVRHTFAETIRVSVSKSRETPKHLYVLTFREGLLNLEKRLLVLTTVVTKIQKRGTLWDSEMKSESTKKKKKNFDYIETTLSRTEQVVDSETSLVTGIK